MKLFAAPLKKVDPFYPLLLLSGLLGYCQGMFGRASWQDAIEGAQVLAGVVHYPVATPYSDYLFKAWTLLHQIPAIFLKLGFSEISLAWCLSGVIGMFSYQVMALAYYRLTKEFIFALTIPFFIDYARFYGDGAVYPVYLMGNSATYGAVGLSYMWLCLLCLCFRKWRIGGFLLGISFAIHPCLAFITCFIALVLIFISNEYVSVTRFFLLGAFIATLSFIIQHVYFPASSAVTAFNGEELKEFIVRWDWHRIVIPWIDRGVLINIFAASLAFCFLQLKKFYDPEVKSLYTAIMLFAVIGLIGVLISHVPIKFVPIFLLRMMLGRLLNFNIFMFGLLTLGILHSLNTNISRTAMSVIIIGAVIASRIFPIFNTGLILCLAIITFAAMFLSTTEPERPGPIPFYRNIHSGAILIFLILFSVKNLIFSFNCISHCKKTFAEDWRNDGFSRMISEGKGLLLIAPHLGGFHMITRRPILFDPGSIDMIPYFPEIGPELREIILAVNGIDILSYPISKIQDHELPADVIKPLWEQRSREEWQVLKRRYAIQNILTPNWDLQLPLIVKNQRNNYYEIP